MSEPLLSGRAHLAALAAPLAALEAEVDRIHGLGRHLARVLLAGGRLLAVGNGGSAAPAQPLTSELVARYQTTERPPLSALAPHAETSSLTSIVNDYGADLGFARQVRAHGRPGDVLVSLSTSGRSRNVLVAVEAANEGGLATWALTGRGPNPLTGLCTESLCVDTPVTATVQEVHQVVIHLLCAAVEEEVASFLSQGERRVRS